MQPLLCFFCICCLHALLCWVVYSKSACCVLLALCCVHLCWLCFNSVHSANKYSVQCGTAVQQVALFVLAASVRVSSSSHPCLRKPGLATLHCPSEWMNVWMNVWMVPCDWQAFHPGCVLPCAQCSWDKLRSHHNLDQDIAVIKGEWIHSCKMNSTLIQELLI